MHRHTDMRSRPHFHKLLPEALKKMAKITPPVTEDWQHLVTENVALAHWVAKTYCAGIRCLDQLEDIRSAALLGLVKAARTYDPEYRTTQGQAVKFSTYATFCIRQALNHHHRQRKRAQPLSLDAAEVENPALLAVEDPPNDHQDEAENVFRLLAMAGLSDRHREALHLYYMEGMSVEEVGCRLGVSKTRVQQIIKKAIRRVRMVADGWRPVLACPECGTEFPCTGGTRTYCGPVCAAIKVQRDRQSAQPMSRASRLAYNARRTAQRRLQKLAEVRRAASSVK